MDGSSKKCDTKDAKKQGLNKRPKVEKDPCTPDDWPFMEQELKAQRALALEELERKKGPKRAPRRSQTAISLKRLSKLQAEEYTLEAS